MYYSLLLTRDMQEGSIVRLTDKGFGFIAREGESKDLFFHAFEYVKVAFCWLSCLLKASGIPPENTPRKRAS